MVEAREEDGFYGAGGHWGEGGYIVGGEGARGVAVEGDATGWPVRMATQRVLGYSSCFQDLGKKFRAFWTL